MHKKLFCILTFIFLSLSAFAGTQDIMSSHMIGKMLLKTKWWKIDKVVEKLDLQETQMDKLEAIYVDYHKEIIKLKSDIELKQFELKELFDQEELDERAIERKFEEFLKIKNELEKKDVMTKIFILKTLDLNQRQELIFSIKKLEAAKNKMIKKKK